MTTERRLQATRDLARTSLDGNATRVHFVGIGGVGMSGIAEVLCTLGSASRVRTTPTTRSPAG